MLLTFTDILLVYPASLVQLSGFFFVVLVFVFVCLFFFLPSSTQTFTLGFFVGQSKEIEHLSFPATCCYSASAAVRGVRLRSRANCCGNLEMSRFAVSCDYGAVREMMVKVKCKLTGIEITRSS